MISAFMSLFRGARGHPRFYINGVEIDKIEPRLAFLDLDDWFTPFLDYVFRERKDWGTKIYAQTEKDPSKHSDTRMIGVWFGPVPEEKKSAGYWVTMVYEGEKEKQGERS